MLMIVSMVMLEMNQNRKLSPKLRADQLPFLLYLSLFKTFTDLQQILEI